jgi:hypothetical protein
LTKLDDNFEENLEQQQIVVKPFDEISIYHQLTKQEIQIELLKFRYIENPNENAKILNGKLMM